MPGTSRTEKTNKQTQKTPTVYKVNPFELNHNLLLSAAFEKSSLSDASVTNLTFNNTEPTILILLQ